MNASSLKTVLVLAVLAGVGYGVYHTLHRPQSAGPAGLPSDWTSAPPDVQLAVTGPSAGAARSARELAPSSVPLAQPSAMLPGAASSRPVNSIAAVPGAAVGADPPPSPVTLATAITSPPDRPDPTGAPAAGDRDFAPARRAFAAVMDDAQTRLDKGQLSETLLALSEWYGDPRLSPEQDRQLNELLGQLAGTVVYSRQHLLEKPYSVKFGDRLETIAEAYHVPWQLLAKINGVRDPGELALGTDLKVVRGPFNAVINLAHYELVLLLDGRYAGRFRIGVGLDCPNREGRFLVRAKTVNPLFRDATGREDSSRPLGTRWIELADGLGIHGTNTPQYIGRTEGRGAIFMDNQDVEELYDILTVGANGSEASNVIVRR